MLVSEDRGRVSAIENKLFGAYENVLKLEIDRESVVCEYDHESVPFCCSVFSASI